MRIRLIHWKASECAERVQRLREAGCDEVDASPFAGPPSVRQLAAQPPLAVVIDLGRLPSQGREVGVALRLRKGTRSLPLVFVDGAADKVARVRQVLPDATFTSWPQIGTALRAALARPAAAVAVPDSIFAAYAGRPLTAKLGVREGAVVALVQAPDGFRASLGDLPEGVTLRAGARGGWDLMLWFVRTAVQLERGIGPRARACHGPMWILWPKKRPGTTGDLTQQAVRARGLAAGLVDYKVCAVDATWSGLLFRRREP